MHIAYLIPTPCKYGTNKRFQLQIKLKDSRPKRFKCHANCMFKFQNSADIVPIRDFSCKKCSKYRFLFFFSSAESRQGWTLVFFLPVFKSFFFFFFGVYPFQDVSRCFKMFQDVSRCFKMFQDVSRCFKMFQDVSRCFKQLVDQVHASQRRCVEASSQREGLAATRILRVFTCPNILLESYVLLYNNIQYYIYNYIYIYVI